LATLALVSYLLDSFEVTISCENAEFLELDADAKLAIMIGAGLARRLNILIHYFVFKPEVYVLYANL
jgi:hypothetical protein